MQNPDVQYNNLIIYYFSGTGNAKSAAEWIINIAGKRGLTTQLINIDRFKKIDVSNTSGKTLIGFCSPTHGFNMPPIMLKFIWKFPRKKDTDVFILNTRGGVKLSTLFLPGLSGLAQIWPAIVLKLKGYSIAGMQPMDLPSNWIILHPGIRNKVVLSIYERCFRITNNFTNDILSGKKKFKALISLPIDLLIIPISFGYYFIGRFFLAKTLIATDDCNQCGKCIEQCPTNAIKMKNDYPFWTYRCESCMRCINICPQRSIETVHGFASIVLYIAYGILFPILFIFFAEYNILNVNSNSIFIRTIWDIIISILFLMVMFSCYRILHLLMRYKAINRIIAYSSLSRYKFWRRYKPPKNTTFKK